MRTSRGRALGVGCEAGTDQALAREQVAGRAAGGVAQHGRALAVPAREPAQQGAAVGAEDGPVEGEQLADVHVVLARCLRALDRRPCELDGPADRLEPEPLVHGPAEVRRVERDRGTTVCARPLDHVL